MFKTLILAATAVTALAAASPARATTPTPAPAATEPFVPGGNMGAAPTVAPTAPQAAADYPREDPRVFLSTHPMTGNELLPKCEAPSGTADAHVCLMTISATIVSAPAFFSIPDKVTMGQLRDIVVKDLHAHPENRHWSADTLVAIALHGLFPGEAYKTKN